MRGFIFSSIIFLIFVSLIIGTAAKVDVVRPDHEVLEYLYLSKYKEVRKFAFGFETEYADLLWIQSLQWFHKRIFKKVPFNRIYDVYDVITDLDPYFSEPYRTGSIYINMITKSSQRGADLLEAGTKKVPNEPWIWEYLGRYYWLERNFFEKRKEMTIKEATKRAISAFGRSYELGKNPEVKNNLQFLAIWDKYATFDTISWVSMYANAGRNDFLKSLIIQKLRIHIIDLHLKTLKEQIQKYHKKYKRWPETLNVLNINVKEPSVKIMKFLIKDISTIIIKNSDNYKKIQFFVNRYIFTKINHKELTRSYIYYNKTGKIYSYHRSNINAQAAVSKLARMLDRYKRKHKEYPKTLEEMILMSFVVKLPDLAPWQEYIYNREEKIVDYKNNMK